IVRVNIFLDTLSRRTDWQNMMERFQASGFKSLRMYINYAYVTGSPFKILVATMIGAVIGLVGGFFGGLGRLYALISRGEATEAESRVHERRSAERDRESEASFEKLKWSFARMLGWGG